MTTVVIIVIISCLYISNAGESEKETYLLIPFLEKLFTHMRGRYFVVVVVGACLDSRAGQRQESEER